MKYTTSRRNLNRVPATNYLSYNPACGTWHHRNATSNDDADGTGCWGRRLLAVRGLFADESALGFGAVVGAMAFPVTHWFLANGLAFGRRISALSVALWVFTYSLALGASALFAVFDRTTHFTLGFAALDLALGVAVVAFAAVRATGG